MQENTLSKLGALHSYGSENWLVNYDSPQGGKKITALIIAAKIHIFPKKDESHNFHSNFLLFPRLFPTILVFPYLCPRVQKK